MHQHPNDTFMFKANVVKFIGLELALPAQEQEPDTMKHYVLMEPIKENEMTEEKEPTPLEKEFEEVFKAAIKDIDEKLNIASGAIAEATKIAEKHGIPFHSWVSPLSQSYTPKSYWEKFGELDPDFTAEVSDVWPADEDYVGWEHSAVC